ncbi:RRP12-like protein [Anthonomus grandis grandis]|uniref:RRP12-like protein n=1 Tax=Anthonomus grandis grandis TaxID=2921223 RepID=UPI0021655636|nr:RRP12-like protein [Anthonomus grandis grandis]
MGKFRSKLKGQTKGKRWAKGQSSSSNPETHKYRDQAKSRFFQENLGGPCTLTTDSLKKHDALQFFKSPKSQNAELSEQNYEMELESDYDHESQGSWQSMKSFASEWSECSNMSFGHFMKSFHADSALHKEMLAILAAIAEVIKQNGGRESSTEYYCALLTTLETIYNSKEKNEDQITAVLALLNMGIKTVPEEVLRKNFSDVSLKMLQILKDFASAENNVIVKSTLGILTVALRAQELAIWTHDTIKQIFAAILNPFSIHSKPKWRKSAQHAVAAIVKSPCFEKNPNHNIAADKCAEFCEGILENCIGGNWDKVVTNSVHSGQTTILHTLGLLKETIQNFSKIHIKKCCETILRLMTLNYPIVNSCGLQVLHSLFSAQTSVVSADINAKLITALYEYQPSNSDVQPTLAWLLVMQEAHVHLADVDISITVTVLPKFFTNITQMWLSGKAEVMTGATHSLEVLLKDVIGPLCESQKTVKQQQSKLEKCFNVIHLCLSYQYNAAWHQVLHVIRVMFEVAGANCSEMFGETLKSLAELRDSYKFSFNNELEYAVGAAIRSMGPEKVLNLIPLKNDSGDLNIDRSWLLPVLKENIKYSTLSFFRDGIFPLARYCQQRAAQLAQANNGIGAHSSELLYLQLWNLLPCFCNHPTDIKTEFKSMAKLLGMAISDRKELRLSVMASLRKLIQGAQENPEDLTELSRFDKNYLPILFNVYTTKPIGSDEEGQRLAALDTIKMYLTIARPDLTEQLFKNAVERLNTSSDEPEDQFIKESILDLIRALIPYQGAKSIETIYHQCVKNLPDIKNNKEQKKAYRILEEIVSSDSDGCKTFVKSNRKEVQRLLRESLSTAATSSKGARLRCLNYLIKSQPHLDQGSKLLRSTIPEAVLCCKDINERCRQIAYDVLNTIGETLLSHDQMQPFVAMLTAGLAGTPHMISSSILALASVLHNFSGALGQANITLILQTIATLASSPTREVVASCLSFIKVYCTTLPSLMVQASLENIMKALLGMTDDCKRHFRIKVRDILDRIVRKYGAETIMPFVPSDDQIMCKRIKNLRKLNDRKKRTKKDKKEQDEEDTVSMEDFIVKSKPKSVEEILADSDSDIDDLNLEHKEMKPKKQVGTWIEEDPDNIVDFTDPSTVGKISATKPGQQNPIQGQKKLTKEANRGFKTASDGRLIIRDYDVSDSDDEKNKLKINFNSDSSASEDEAASVAETLLMANRKRKRPSSVKSGFSASTAPPSKYKTGGVGIHRSLNSASSVKSGTSALGTEYKSKKAAGDVKKKGKKFDPYAYIPLQRSTLNKRKKTKGMGQLKGIVKGARKGVLKGAKAKRNRKNNL